MKKFIKFLISTRDPKYKTKGLIEPEHFERLRQDFPEFWTVVPNPFMAYLTAPLEGEKTRQLLNFIESIGLRPYWARFPHVNEMPLEERWVEIKGILEFEPDDFEKAPFFFMLETPDSVMGESAYDDEKNPSVEEFNPAIQIGYIISIGSGYFQKMMRDKFETENFTGLVLREEQFKGVPFPLWHMESDREMPPAINQWYQSPYFREKEPNYGLFDESIYEPWPFEYRAKDLIEMAGIDFANTHEWIGGNGPNPGNRKLMCSKRFYDWAKAENLPFNFVPVLVED